MKFKKIEDEPLALLEHIDLLQRLGLSYHFENEIKSALKGIYESTNKLYDDKWKRDNLYATALEFRLLRQHGFWVPQGTYIHITHISIYILPNQIRTDINRLEEYIVSLFISQLCVCVYIRLTRVLISDVFNAFKDHETGNFRASTSDDISGLLSLYEASFHSVQGETILEEARDFSTRCLEKYLKKNEDKDNELALLVSHALDTPLHWKVRRLEARWFIDVYGKRLDKNTSLHKLAILDFNVVQSKHLEDLKDVSRYVRTSRALEHYYHITKAP